MILKYEKLSSKMVKGKEEISFKAITKKDATHLHKCRHDETPQGPCSREKI